MIGRTVLVAAAILALAGSAPSAAKDEAGAKKIADDLWLASIAARDCPDTSLNKDMLLFWSKTLISDFDGDKDIAADLVQTTKGLALRIAADAELKLGLTLFCGAMWTGYSENGIERANLIHHAP